MEKENKVLKCEHAKKNEKQDIILFTCNRVNRPCTLIIETKTCQMGPRWD